VVTLLKVFNLIQTINKHLIQNNYESVEIPYTNFKKNEQYSDISFKQRMSITSLVLNEFRKFD